ncbi:MAG: mevalonate kinase [Candidatus Heimdallarchaeaceae archaeon]
MIEQDSVSYSAPGKVILFGEHAVVYGYPAIAVAIDKRVTTSIKPSTLNEGSLSVPDLFYGQSFPLTFTPSTPKSLQASYFIIEQLMNKARLLSSPNIKIKASFPPSAGLGSSAATSVSLIKALSSFLRLQLTLEDINRIAFEVEKIQHGTPSGIDNTVATYGGGIYYCKGQIERISLPSSSLYWVIVNSKVKRKTKNLVLKVRKRYEKDKENIESVFRSIESLVLKAKTLIKQGQMLKIGEIMNKNQNLLEELGVGHPKITEILKILENEGSLGAKLTGAGGGGCVIGLFSTKEEALKAIEHVERKGFQAFLTTPTNTGVRKNE